MTIIKFKGNFYVESSLIVNLIWVNPTSLMRTSSGSIFGVYGGVFCRYSHNDNVGFKLEPIKKYL